MLKKEDGFTLVEMVIVMSIISIISGFGFVKLFNVQESTKLKADYVVASNIALATNLYLMDNPNSNSVTLQNLKDGNYIDFIPKPQSENNAEFEIDLSGEDIKIKANGEVFYPKVN